MSDPIPLAKYQFLPWYRTGLSAMLGSPPTDTSKLRPSLQLTVEIDNENARSSTNGSSVTKNIELLGPGDFTGFNSLSISKTDPISFSETRKTVIVNDFEPNYFPFVEFSEPDFPWKGNPLREGIEGDENRLRPWICLIVLEDVQDDYLEFKFPEDNDSNPKLQYITVNKIPGKGFPLPDLQQIDAWAHVHITTDKDDEHISDSELKTLIEGNPESAVSRILCPRRLKPNRKYFAFICPTFLSGHNTALHLPNDGVLIDDFAWDISDINGGSNDKKQIPYFYKWEFNTAERGDFEHLVTILEPHEIDSRVGIRGMDCSNPGYNLKDLILGPQLVKWTLGGSGAFTVGEEITTADDSKIGIVVTTTSGTTGTVTYILKSGTNFVSTDVVTGTISAKTATLGPPKNLENEPDLGLEGALKSLTTQSTVWPPDYDEFQPKLTEILNLSNAQLSNKDAAQNTNLGISGPILGPPIYGKWHAARRTISSSNNRRWLNTLNLDPRHRAVSEFANKVIKDQKQALMYSAWKQIDNLEKVNDVINKARLACESSFKIFEQNLLHLSASNLLTFTGSLHTRILTSVVGTGGNTQYVTLKNKIDNSRIPYAVFDPAFRKINRNRGPFRRRQHEQSSDGDVVDRLNSGDIEAAGPHPDPDGTTTVGDIANRSHPRLVPKWLCKILTPLSQILLIIAVISLGILSYLINQGILSYDNNTFILFLILAAIAFLIYLLRLANRCDIATSLQEENITPEVVADVPPRPDFAFSDPPSGSTFEDFPPSGGTEDSPQAELFRAFAIIAQGYLTTTSQVEEEKPKLNLEDIQSTILDAINPLYTIPNYVLGRISHNGFVFPSSEKLVSVMAAPEFPQPMYEPLRDISQDYLLPGLEFVPQNTIGLLLTNQKFVESCMIGYNHSCAAMLRSEEYKTDLRGSYFSQFWDVRGAIIPESIKSQIISQVTIDLADELVGLPPEKAQIIIQNEVTKRWDDSLKDITPVHTWLNSNLGENRPTRYNESSSSTEIIKTPLFEGNLEPDVNFFGFDFSVEEAKGSPDFSDGNPGYFFVIMERLGECRFGFDVGDEPANLEMENWNEMTWGYLKKAGLFDEETGSGYVTITPGALDTNNPDDPEFEKNSSSISWISLQQPFRLAVHADDMIPENSASGENENLVLLLRGNLLKKYPRTFIFAEKARFLSDNITRWPTSFREED